MEGWKPLNPINPAFIAAMPGLPISQFRWSSRDTVGFVLCGQVRLSNDVGLVDILNVDDRWQADPELVNEFRNVPEMDYSRVIASADLLKLIVENCLKKQLNFVVIKDNPQQSEPVRANRSTNPHDSKMKKALRYIDAHLSDDLRLEDVASHVFLSPYYFSKLFKNIRVLVLTHG